jgi:hypothetical protein
MSSPRRAVDAIPLIKARLAELEERGGREPLITGRLAALWRAEARAAKLGLTIEDLRRYCLEMLRSRRALDDDTPDYACAARSARARLVSINGCSR